MADNSLSATQRAVCKHCGLNLYLDETSVLPIGTHWRHHQSNLRECYIMFAEPMAALSVESGEGTPQPNQDQLREAGELLERLRIQAIQKAENDGGRLTLSPEKYSAVEDKFWRSIASFCMASLAVARESTAPRKDTATAPSRKGEKKS